MAGDLLGGGRERTADHGRDQRHTPRRPRRGSREERPPRPRHLHRSARRERSLSRQRHVRDGEARHRRDQCREGKARLDWRIETLRLQHQIWLRTAQRPESEHLIAKAIGDATFFRSDVDTYCSDDMPSVDVDVLETELRRLHDASNYPFRVEFHPPLPVEGSCTLISNYAFVDPRGRLYPCLTLDMGNVFERPFESVWNGSKFRAFRRLLRREQRLPLCERCPA